MNKTIKKVVTLLIVSIISLNFNYINVYAEPSLQDKKAEKENQYSDIMAQIEESRTKASALDNEIGSIMSRKSEIESLISEKEELISEKEREIEEKEAELKDREYDFQERVKSVYKNGSEPIIDLLVSSKSIGDLIDRSEIVKGVSKYDRRLISGLKESKVSLSKVKDDLENDRESLKMLKGSLDTEAAQLEVKLSEQEKTQEELNNIKNTYSAELDKINEEIRLEAEAVLKRNEEKTAQIAQNTAGNSNNTNNSGSQQSNNNNNIVTPEQPEVTPPATNTNLANAVLEEARKHLGKPYVWGAKGPDTFDCSGFVQYVFKQVGINAPAPTYTQVNLGKQVPIGQEQPGDLVFFGSISAPHHVGIYVGDGIYIHAPQTGDYVKYSKLMYAKDYSQARRLIN
ncbi:NLP/P60 protein [Clostridium bornimense]|uniref:NLP/P60 protein n=1 Tax=Clostridium bornimense TaxID=1216932 RepID=W6S210_9CLOT|nr:C40 family peptidase [Clostridium bornimense]CDM68352.1 NLP/P60 protein [Clostridium bornimense]